METTAHILDLPISTNRGWLSEEFCATGIDFANTRGVLAWLDGIEAKTVMASDG